MVRIPCLGAVVCLAVPCHAVLCSAVLHRAIARSAVLCPAPLCRTVSCCALLCCGVLRFAVLRRAASCCAVSRFTMVCCAAVLQAVLWMQLQRDAQVVACVDSTSRTVEVWWPTRQVLALALYVGESVRSSRGMAADWDQDTEMHRVRNVMGMVDYGVAIRGTRGHTVQAVSPQASATGAAGQGVTDLVQDGHTSWVVEPRGDNRTAVMYTVAPLRRVDHPLMRWVAEAEEVQVERAEEIHTRAILRALGSQMGRCAKAEEADDIKEQIWLALEWLDSSREENEPRWI